MPLYASLYQSRASRQTGGFGCNVLLLFFVAVALAISLNWETVRDWATHLMQGAK